MRGTITSSGFASGDRFVVGRWDETPMGPTVDVMWARPDGTRVLLVPDDATAAFVTGVYEFDEVHVVPFRSDASHDRLQVHAGLVELDLLAGRTVLRLPPRPRWCTRWIERPVARLLMGVRTWGTSPTGVQEWYQASDCRFLTGAVASVDGRDLGAMAPLDPACRFGFSESPRRPSMVRVRPTLGVPIDPASASAAEVPEQLDRTHRRLALAGVVGVLGFVTAWAVRGATRPHYSSIDDAISQLAAADAPGRNWMTAGFVAFGIGAPLYSLALRRALPGRAWMTAAATGLCTLGVAAAPLGDADTGHFVAALAGYVTLSATPLLASRDFRRAGRREWANWSVAAGVASALFLIMSTGGDRHGLAQRLGLGATDLWIVCTALVMWRSGTLLGGHRSGTDGSDSGTVPVPVRPVEGGRGTEDR